MEIHSQVLAGRCALATTPWSALARQRFGPAATYRGYGAECVLKAATSSRRGPKRRLAAALQGVAPTYQRLSGVFTKSKCGPAFFACKTAEKEYCKNQQARVDCRVANITSGGFTGESGCSAASINFAGGKEVPTGTCPECDADVHVDTDTDKGETVSCEECGTDLEVVGLDPVELDIVEEEDLDDDDDEDEF